MFRSIFIYYNERDWENFVICYGTFILSNISPCAEVNHMKESEFQSRLIKKLEILFPGCYVLKNDANYIQGIPDLLVLYKDKWATLECKREASAPHRPNQDYHVDKMNQMSFSAFIFPENEKEVLYALKKLFRQDEGSTCVSRSEQIFMA